MDEVNTDHLVWVARLRKQYGPPEGPLYGPSDTPLLIPAGLANQLGLPIVEKPWPTRPSQDAP